MDIPMDDIKVTIKTIPKPKHMNLIPILQFFIFTLAILALTNIKKRIIVAV